MAERKTPHALIVDDEDTILRLLIRLLSHEGWEVTAVSNGSKALAVFQAGKYDLVLSDINFGGVMDGFDLAQRLKTIDPNLKIVLMSGTPGLAARAAGMGESVIHKPFQDDEISRLLRKRAEEL